MSRRRPSHRFASSLISTLLVLLGCGDPASAPEQPSPEAPRSHPTRSASPTLPDPSASPEDFVEAHLQRLAHELPCGEEVTASPLAPFCTATRWAEGVPAPLPNRSLIGVTSFVLTEGPLAVNLQRLRALSVLGIHRTEEALRADITSPRARPGDMAPEVAAASVIEVLSEARPGPIRLPRGLFAFFQQRGAQAAYPINQRGGGWHIEGGSNAELRRVGSSWVAIEVPREHPRGIYVSIFADNEVQGMNL